MTTRPACSAIYAHTPFCHTLCGYCDFYSVVYERASAHPLVDAIIRESQQAGKTLDLAAHTIFVGGGTPTTLPPDALSRLLRALVAHAAAQAPLEFTVEANPATVSPKVADTLAQAGVNRVSIGAQSFDPAELRVLERIHAPAQVATTLRNCRQAGVQNLNLDLIFAIPGQTLARWLANLQSAIDLEPEHLSCYGLTYEPGTPLYERRQRRQVQPVDEALEAEMYEATVETLAAAGYRQYEISNFAKPGRECRHNLVYWRNEPYLGLGPSAAGYLDGVRYKNVSDHVAYAQAVAAGRSPRVEQESLSPEAGARESMMLELRLTEGVDRSRFAGRFGADPAQRFERQLQKHVELQVLEVTPRHIRLTPAGRLLADAVIADYF